MSVVTEVEDNLMTVAFDREHPMRSTLLDAAHVGATYRLAQATALDLEGQLRYRKIKPPTEEDALWFSKAIAVYKKVVALEMEAQMGVQAQEVGRSELVDAIAAHRVAVYESDEDAEPEPYDLALWSAAGLV